MNPSSVPPWNERRFTALSSISPDNRTLIISTPAEFTRYIVGLASLLGETNVWAYEQGALSATQIADEYNDRTSYVYDLCALILSCIENDDDVRRAISSIAEEIAEETVGGKGTPDSPSVYDSNTSVVSDCGLDNLFGSVTQLVDLANTLIEDLLERFTSTVNNAETLSIIIEAIPIVGTLPVDEAFELGVKVVEDFQQVYEASYDSALRDEYRCELFCIAQDDENCELSFTDVADYFLTKTGASILNLNFNDFVEFFTQGTFSGVEVVHALHALLFGVLGYGAKWVGVDVARVEKLAQSFLNDPDTDWSTLCDCANAWTETFDFTQNSFNQYISQINPSYPAQWVSGSGWVGGQDSSGTRDGIIFTPPAGTNIVRVETTIYVDSPNRNTRTTGLRVALTSGSLLEDVDDNVSGSPPYTKDFEVNNISQAVDEVRLRTGARPASGECIVRGLVIEGTGVNPF